MRARASTSSRRRCALCQRSQRSSAAATRTSPMMSALMRSGKLEWETTLLLYWEAPRSEKWPETKTGSGAPLPSPQNGVDAHQLTLRASWNWRGSSAAVGWPALQPAGSVGLQSGLTSPTLKRLKRSEEHTSELQSRLHLVCRLLLEKKKKNK